MEILIAGDLMPTKSNKDLFNSADIIALLGEELFSVWSSADVRIFNLEVPLTDLESPISKCGPNLIAPTSTVNGIKALNPTLIALANNHILDQGGPGFKTTKDVLKKHNIPVVGADENLSEASKPYLILEQDMKIGVYACAENEFSIATEFTAGANPFDPLESLDHIKALKDKCNYVIVLYHGGKEHYRYPSPYLQKVCRKMVQKGADLVICQHSHCIGCYEEYEGAVVVYGLGNFIFDLSESEYWQTSLLIKANIIDRNIEYIPIVKKENGVRLATENEMKDILSLFRKRSQDITEEEFIEQKYKEYAIANIHSYLSKFSGSCKLVSFLEKKFSKGLLLNKKYNKKKLSAIQNYVECEAHRELLLSGLKQKRMSRK